MHASGARSASSARTGPARGTWSRARDTCTACRESLSLAQAALAEPLAVVMKGLRRLGSRHTGDQPRKCVVIGAGTIGQLAALVLKLRVTRSRSLTANRSASRRSVARWQRQLVLRIMDKFEWLVEATGSQSRAFNSSAEGVHGRHVAADGAPVFRPDVQLRGDRCVRSLGCRIGRQQWCRLRGRHSERCR